MPSDDEYVGIPSSPRMDVALSQVGPVQLELIHPADDEVSIYQGPTPRSSHSLISFGRSSSPHLDDERVG
jgi:hypothetical protein